MPISRQNRTLLLSRNQYLVPSFIPQAVSYFSQLAIQPSVSEKIIDNTAISSLIAGSNNYSKIDRLVFFSGEHRENATTSVVNPTSTKFEETGSMLWNTSGFQGFASSYLRSHFTPSVDAVNYTQNSGCVFWWSLTDVANDNYCDFGAQNTTPTQKALFCFTRGATDALSPSVNDASGGLSAYTNTNSTGFYSLVRDSSTTFKLYKNGTLIGTKTVSSTALVDLEIFIFGLNQNGGLQYYSPRQLELFGIGSGTINQTELYNTMLARHNSIAAMYPSPAAPSVAPMNNPILKLSIPSLIDSSGNGYDSTLGAGLISGFTAPTVDGSNNIVFNGNNTIKLHTSFGLSPLRVHTEFMAIYTDTPEETQGLLNVGLQYICGMRIATYTRDGNKWVNIGGVYYDEGAATEPVWGRSLPKLQAGYNVIGFSFSSTVTIMYCNGQITYFSPNNTYTAVGTSGWIGGFPTGPDAAYTLPAYYKLVANSYVQVFNYAGNTGQMLSTGNNILATLGCSMLVNEGDSITQGFSLTNNADNWPAIVTSYLLNNTSYKWASCNIGIGARKLQTMATDCSTVGASVPFNKISTVSVNPVSKSSYASAKNIYVLLAGINDLAAGRTLANLQADFTTLINYRNSQGFKCFVLSVTSDVGLTAPQETIRLQYNSWLATQTATLNFVFINICSDPNLAGQPSGPDAYFSDGVHWTALTCSSIVAPMVYTSIMANY